MAEIILTWLLLFSCLFLMAATLVLVRNRYDLTPLPRSSAGAGPGSSTNQTDRNGSLPGFTGSDLPVSSGDLPLFSILIPARNEEEDIEKCIRSACNQTYPNYEVLVLDDGSTDRTLEILTRLASEYPNRLKVLKGAGKPENWLGKSWACAQLAESAEGHYLVFIDSDVFLEPGTLERTWVAFDSCKLDMLTIWPRQQLGTFWEKTLIPLVYYALVTLLPAIYVYRPPRWMPALLKEKTRKLFAAACGQFLAFSRHAYEESGGHHNVREDPVEDVGLARLLLDRGYRMRMFEGTDTVSCRMYKNEKEIRSGFRKNFFAGFGYSFSLFITAAILHMIVYILPFIILPVALILWQPILFFLSSAAVSLIFLHWMILSIWFGWNPLYALTHPVGVGWFQVLGIRVLFDRISGNKTDWKERSL